MKRILLLLLLAVLTACTYSSPASPGSTSDIPPQTYTAPTEETAVDKAQDGTELEVVVKKLASPGFDGRLVGTEGNWEAARYIAGIFETIGLEKYMDAGWLQEYTHTHSPHFKEMYGIVEDTTPAGNVIGKISGTDQDNVLVLSAHFDHLGLRGGTLYPGAIDNSSGIAILLDVAANLKEKFTNIPPECDIIICAFNGEENGLQGSKALVGDLESKYSEICNINIECIEGMESQELILVGDPELASPLGKRLEDHLETAGLPCEAVGNKYGSDHLSFSAAGHPSLTLGQEGTSTLHTPWDTPDRIDFNFLDGVSQALYEFVAESRGKVNTR